MDINIASATSAARPSSFAPFSSGDYPKPNHANSNRENGKYAMNVRHGSDAKNTLEAIHYPHGSQHFLQA
jgi:hypothetical protein